MVYKLNQKHVTQVALPFEEESNLIAENMF